MYNKQEPTGLLRLAFVGGPCVFFPFVSLSFASWPRSARYPRESPMLGAAQRAQDAVGLGGNAAKEKWVGVRHDARMPVACGTALSRRALCDGTGGLRRLSGGGAEDNKESGRLMGMGGASWGQGEWERRGGKGQAVTMGVTSIKEKGIYYRLWFARRLFIPGGRGRSRRTDGNTMSAAGHGLQPAASYPE